MGGDGRRVSVARGASIIVPMGMSSFLVKPLAARTPSMVFSISARRVRSSESTTVRGIMISGRARTPRSAQLIAASTIAVVCMTATSG